MKELAIATNMITMARNAKTLEQKRSLMLRMILPLLSTATADKLAKTITNHNSREFAQIWEQVKPEIANKIASDRAEQSATAKPPQMVATASIGGIEWAAMHPSEQLVDHTVKSQIEQSYGVTSEQICKLVKLVCERLLMQADPCPLPPRLMKIPGNCAEHDWPDCKVCLHGIKGFDFNANILELYDKLCASSI